MIQLQNISVIFNKGTTLENTALKQVDLKIHPGDFITLMGDNGAGKSTLMSVISGEIIPTEGRVIFDGMDITHFSVEKRAPLISRVFQDPRTGVCEWLTLEENLAFAMKRGCVRGFTLARSRTLKEKYMALLKTLGMNLEHRLQDHAGLLSGGQRQALSLIMATLQPFKILLLDEPTAALDPQNEKTVLELVRKITCDPKITTLMITHNTSHAEIMGNRTMVMRQGEILKKHSL